MSRYYKTAILVGSLRKASYNRKLAQALVAVAPDELAFDFVEISDLPLYNEDLETDNPPAAWVRFRAEIASADAVLFVTPEYNRSVPAVLKNAIDVGSRPYGRSVWNGKPAAIVSSSQGGIGGFGANHHLRQSLVFNNVQTMQQPEAYISHIQNLVTEDGRAADEKTRAYLADIMAEFDKWVHRIIR